MIALFNTSPDFDQERTRYQVEHIAGASGHPIQVRRRVPPWPPTATVPGEDELCREGQPSPQLLPAPAGCLSCLSRPREGLEQGLDAPVICRSLFWPGA
ncbi:MAG: hypothetical protein MZV64_50565 [Ignavibacteriales bacterium]|nr:hypothetical protein [Ignavibacteriales bacterium]